MKHILIKSDNALDQVAEHVRSALNLKGRNKSPHFTDQGRYGVNLGGYYYLFEILGFEIYLLGNSGEVILDSYKEYDYYIYITLQVDFDDNKFADSLTEYISQTLKENNLEIAVIDE